MLAKEIPITKLQITEIVIYLIEHLVQTEMAQLNSCYLLNGTSEMFRSAHTNIYKVINFNYKLKTKLFLNFLHNKSYFASSNTVG
ncbi:MAG: hypothetical protein RLZZ118_2237 [Bacteroidota bacterium]|jgi:hypothetical protein